MPSSDVKTINVGTIQSDSKYTDGCVQSQVECPADLKLASQNTMQEVLETPSFTFYLH